MQSILLAHNSAQEVDYVEERDGAMRAFEFKWNEKAKAPISKSFLQGYPHAQTDIIHPGNAAEWLLEKL